LFKSQTFQTLIKLYKGKPPKKEFKPLLKYQNLEFKKKIDLKIINEFFIEFPEEKRGRKNFKSKEILNIKALLYNQIIQKSKLIDADCVGSIHEKVVDDTVIIQVSYFKNND